MELCFSSFDNWFLTFSLQQRTDDQRRKATDPGGETPRLPDYQPGCVFIPAGSILAKPGRSVKVSNRSHRKIRFAAKRAGLFVHFFAVAAAMVFIRGPVGRNSSCIAGRILQERLGIAAKAPVFSL